MSGKYYTLCVYDTDSGRWVPEFGDYDRNVVKDELYDVWFTSEKPKNHFTIVTSTDDQTDINRAVSILNNGSN